MLEENEMNGYADKIDQYNPARVERIAETYRAILEELGEDPEREGLREDARARGEGAAVPHARLRPRSRGDPALGDVPRGIPADGDRARTSRSTRCASTTCCRSSARRTSPTFPNGHIVGLSKIPRVVDAFARRLQVQERLTVEIRNCIEDTLKPLGVAVVIEAQHMCMVMRGIQKQHSIATTSAFTGEFNTEKTRAEFMRLITSGVARLKTAGDRA